MDTMADAITNSRREYKGKQDYYHYLRDSFLWKKNELVKVLKNHPVNFDVIEP